VAGSLVRALRVSYVGELGWELHIPIDGMAQVYDALWAAGQAHGLENFGSFTLNALRMEKGFKGASELTTEVTLPEADIMRFCKLDKGDFVGRAATIASHEKATKPWLCVYLKFDATGDADPLGTEALLVDGKRVGAVSSCAYAPYVDQVLGFGYVGPDHAAPGTILDVHVMGETITATVLAEPVYDPNSEKPRTDG